MVFFFISALGISLIAMVTLLAVKRYELASGRMLFAGVRPKTSAFFQIILQWGQKILPALALRYIERVWMLLRTKTQRAIAYSIVTFERTLESTLSAVRERTQGAHPDLEPSAFLREVADHKKSLLKDSHSRDNLQE
jgi:hypothetical protein